MRRSPSFSCPNCGFAVFNRRYPKCEQCGVQLPEGMRHSGEEVAALRTQEEAEELARKDKERPPSPSGGGDSWAYVSGSGGSSDGGCAADGGSCGGGD